MRAKKSLGQNFLKNKTILKKIVEAGEVGNDDVVLEIGPGKGALTEMLLEKAGQVVAVEKDNQLFEFLKEKFKNEIEDKKLILINYDILSFNFDSFSVKEKEHKLRSYKIIANIPYNITGAILKKFLTEGNQPGVMVLMVQHEVARRIVANDNKESILSISVKAYGQPKLVTKVDKRFFSPQPKVNSAVIKINNINREVFAKNKINEDRFWEIVKKGFAHKRKKLSGNLKGVIKTKNLELELLKNKRAEDLSLENWINLTRD